MAAASLVVSSSVAPQPVLALSMEPAESILAQRYSKVKPESKVEGAKAVLQQKVQSAKQEAVN